MTLLDPIGAIASLLCTFFSVKGHRLTWPLGLCAVCVNAVLYYQKGIYGHLILDAVYFVSMLYGWLHWSHLERQPKKHRIRSLSSQHAWGWAAICICASLSLGRGLSVYTDSVVPYWDASITVLSLCAQWLLCRKVVQCWLLWLLVDSLVVGLYFYKAIPWHASVHVLYLGMAIHGYRQWQAQLKTAPTQVTTTPPVAAHSH